jgi:two-component system nitrogen regulation response regulator GlnG
VRILVVDDDAAFRKAISRALRAAGHDVEEASDGGKAQQVLKSLPPDLLITDIMMPDGDGFELISAMKRMHPAVRILVVSGRKFFGSLDLLHMAGRLGADDTLGKPFSTEQLLDKVTALLEPRPGTRPG